MESYVKLLFINIYFNVLPTFIKTSLLTARDFFNTEGQKEDKQTGTAAVIDFVPTNLAKFPCSQIKVGLQ
jgi:hypothetical protein